MSLVWSHNSGSAPKLAGVKKKSELLWKQQQKKQKTKQQTKPTQSKTGIVKSASSVEERWWLMHHSGVGSMAWNIEPEVQQRKKDIAILKDMWRNQQNSGRKPGLHPARSPEITQGKPHGHNESHVWNIPED